jgi:hypothetical protein
MSTYETFYCCFFLLSFNILTSLQISPTFPHLKPNFQIVGCITCIPSAREVLDHRLESSDGRTDNRQTCESDKIQIACKQWKLMSNHIN